MSNPIVNALVEAAKAGKFPKKFGKREDKLIESVLDSSVKMVPVTWDFAVQGGAAGTIDLGASVPADSVVTAVWCDITTAITGSGSIKLSTSTSVDLTQTLSAQGTSVVASSATPKKISLAGGPAALKAVIATGLTAGKVTFHVQYV